jgi:diadenosine tetraphosphatase ApaH/serine/threonine PP2A family protein phosphatase
MRVLVLSDIHANLTALDAVLMAAGSFDSVWCLGDLVGYGPDPNECVERIRDLPDLQCIAGNHDRAASGEMALDAFNPEAHQALEWTGNALTEDTRRYLSALPESITADPYFLVHGSPRKPLWEYLLDSARAQGMFASFPTRYCLVGHSHVAMAFVLSDQDRCITHLPAHGRLLSLGFHRMILNPGSVGQPRDQDPRASYVLLDTDTLQWEWHRVEYDVESVQKRMQNAALPARLILRLAEGW